MKVEYLGVINEAKDEILRIFDFDYLEANKFRDVIIEDLINCSNPVNLTELPFIESLNCGLILCLTNDSKGITSSDGINFLCELTIDDYKNIIYLLEPFCQEKDCNGYQWLYDINTPIEFLFSPGGTW